MHWQADDFLRQRLADRNAALADRVMLVGLLTMQRDRIVDRGRHALGLERGSEGIARSGLEADGVLRPHRRHAGRHHRHGDDVAQRFVVAAGDTVARIDLIRENLELLDQHRRLNGVKARGQAEADIVVAIAAHAMNAHTAHQVGEIIVIGERRAAVAITAERLGRKEAGRGDGAEGADAAIIIGRAEALRRVVDDKKVMCLGGGRNRPVVGRLAEQIDRDDRLGFEAKFARFFDRPGNMLRVHVEGHRIDIDEDRRRADQRHDLGRRTEG